MDKVQEIAVKKIAEICTAAKLNPDTMKPEEVKTSIEKYGFKPDVEKASLKIVEKHFKAIAKEMKPQAAQVEDGAKIEEKTASMSPKMIERQILKLDEELRSKATAEIIPEKWLPYLEIFKVLLRIAKVFTNDKIDAIIDSILKAIEIFEQSK